MNDKVRDFFKNNLGYLVVALISIIYVLTAFITVDKTGKTISQMIADGSIAFILGVAINTIFDLQGIMNGERDARVVSTILLHGETLTRLSPVIDKLDNWCEVKNKEALQAQRTRILATEGLRYSDWFYEDGLAKPYIPDKVKLADKYQRWAELRRMKCYKKAVCLKLTLLTSGVLTSEGGKAQDPFNLGRSKAQYVSTTRVRDIASKLVTGVVLGYYGVRLIQNFSYASLIWTSLQVGIFIIMGVIKMYQSYNFVVDEYRGRIVKKIDNLLKFENYINNLSKEVLTVLPNELEGGIEQ